MPVATVTVDSNTGSATQGMVTAITFTSYGSGYTSAPTATISDGEGNSTTVALSMQAGSGQIYGATIANAGTGYTAPATITFKDATGSGATATAAVVGPNNSVSYAPVGVVNSFAITGNGSGYTAAPSVVFTEAAGNAAGARQLRQPWR